MPSYKAVHSAAPTLYRKKPRVGSGVRCPRAGAAMARLPSRPKAAAATAAFRTRSRRVVVSILDARVKVQFWCPDAGKPQLVSRFKENLEFDNSHIRFIHWGIAVAIIWRDAKRRLYP